MRKLNLILCVLLGVNLAYANDIICKDSSIESKPVSNVIKWYRNSVEKRALYHQTFNNGLKYIMAYNKHHKPWGVILDIDETTLDNSWYYKQCGDVSSEDEFSRYVVLAEASEELPGAKNFTCKIKQIGGYVTLLSNRDGSYTLNDKSVLASTINNLKSQGVCFDQVVLANRKTAPNPSDKNPRFNAVIKGTCDTKLMVCSNILPSHAVIAYFGDNIQDFPKLFQADLITKSAEDGKYNMFSNGYFILPNPLYGSWMKNN
ncbi:MAG: 5'-nucleotidase, lipoprotein e(P4) family [Proteobacteria bacterium]|jgi:5'-nucleotidase (lipoprotein e(P4) family)|nr:5'-nucleotidase, lipoprotein e(P4) family [Pseudomonadota bacterium]